MAETRLATPILWTLLYDVSPLARLGFATAFIELAVLGAQRWIEAEGCFEIRRVISLLQQRLNHALLA